MSYDERNSQAQEQYARELMGDPAGGYALGGDERGRASESSRQGGSSGGFSQRKATLASVASGIAAGGGTAMMAMAAGDGEPISIVAGLAVAGLTTAVVKGGRFFE